MSGRLLVLDHSILGSRRRVLRCNYRKILVRSLTLLTAVVVPWLGSDRFGVGYGGWFGGGLQGFGRSLGFEISIQHMFVVEPGCELVGLFEVFRSGGTHDIADDWGKSASVLHDCLGNVGDLVRT